MRIKLNIPESIRNSYTGQKCQTLLDGGKGYCNSPLFKIEGQIVCGSCQTRKLKQQAAKERDANIDDTRLQQFHLDKKPKSKDHSSDIVKKVFGGSK